jgi:dihydroflavonol-4-reductase
MIIDIANRRAPGYSSGVNNFVDVRDVGRGMIAAWQRGRTGERYILGHENLPYKEIFERIAKVAEVKPPSLAIPRWVAAPLGWFGDVQESLTGKDALVNSNALSWGYASNFCFKSDKARRELGYTSGPIETAIADAIAWFRGRGMLKA